MQSQGPCLEVELLVTSQMSGDDCYQGEDFMGAYLIMGGALWGISDRDVRYVFGFLLYGVDCGRLCVLIIQPHTTSFCPFPALQLHADEE